MNDQELMKKMAETLVYDLVVDSGKDGKDPNNIGFAECLICDSFGSYPENVRHTDSCIFHQAKEYLEREKK